MQPVSQEPSQFLPFAGTSVGAIGRSGGEYLGNLGQAVLHPIQTAKGLVNIGVGTAQKALPGTQPQEIYADAVGDFIKQRYGSFDALRETWKRDPVGVAADAASILTAGGGAVTKIGTVQGLQRTATAGRVATRVAQVIDPLTVTLQAAKVPVGILSRGVEGIASRAINNLIKPTNRQFAFGKNPGRAVAQEGIVASSLDDLAVKIGQRRQVVGQKIGSVLSNPEVANQSVNAANALDPLNQALTVARKNPRTNAAVIQRLENVRDDLLGTVVNPDGTTTVTRDLTKMRPIEVLELKQMVGDLTKWTENLSDDTLVNGSLKQVYAKLRLHIERVAPGIHPLNERYANLLEAERAARNQAHATMRQSPFGLSDVILGTAGGMRGGLDTALVGILLSQGAKAAMRSPYLRTELAKWVQRASPTEVTAFFNRIPGLQGEAMRVGILAGTGQQRVSDLQSNRQPQ